MPFLSYALSFRRNSVALIEQCRAKYGKVFTLSLVVFFAVLRAR